MDEFTDGQEMTENQEPGAAPEENTDGLVTEDQTTQIEEPETEIPEPTEIPAEEQAVSDPESVPENPETGIREEQSSVSPAPLPTAVLEDTEMGIEDQDDETITSDLEKAEQDAEITQEPEATPTPVLDYEELLEELQTQTEELKAIREVTDQQTEYNQNMLNIGIVSIVGFGLVCGFVAALIFSNYMRH